MVYRVEVAGRIFQGTDPRALIRLAVQFRKTLRPGGSEHRNRREERQPSSENSAAYAQSTAARALRLLHKSYAKC
jgi:hypothetical protein